MGIQADNMRVLFVVLAIALVATADELKDLSSADAPTPVKDVAKESSDLGEEEGSFGGALMTFGSFTMMAAGAAFEEEESKELGESEGSFGGALMTSGSFTMMAAGAAFEE